jgi:hypothetical protein
MADMKRVASGFKMEIAAKRLACMQTLPPESGVLYELLSKPAMAGVLLIIVPIPAKNGEYTCVAVRQAYGSVIGSRQLRAREYADGLGLELENGNILRMFHVPEFPAFDVHETGPASECDRLLGPSSTKPIRMSVQLAEKRSK